MSEIHVDSLKNKAGAGAPDFPAGVTVSGVSTFAHQVDANGSVDVAGIVTASHGFRATTGGINVVAGVSTFGGDVSISGVLTYEDVRNVDALGIVTARNGFRATAGGINIVSGVSTFANQIDANGSVDITGIATASHGARVTAGGLNVVSGVSTFANQVDANGSVDITGIVTASHGARVTAGGINIVSGVSTFANQIDANGSVDITGIVTASHGLRATVGGINVVAGVSTVKEDAIFSATTGTGTTIGLGGINVSGIVTAYHGFDGPGNIPGPSQTSGSGITLATTDAGKFVSSSGAVTVAASILAVGEGVTIYNSSGGNITLTCSAPTAVYLGSDGSTKTSITLAAKCVCTFFCVDAASNGTYVCIGGGIS